MKDDVERHDTNNGSRDYRKLQVHLATIRHPFETSRRYSMSIAARPMQDGGSDMVETDIESSNSASARNGEQITLSFDNSSGGAWDDRELVNAYDAAMDEFHVSLH